MIPVFAVTGFLGAGKTFFLQELLSRPEWAETELLVLQFEAGEQAFSCPHERCRTLYFSLKTVENYPEKIMAQIIRAVEERTPKAVWLEWNGMLSFSLLQGLLLQPPLRNRLRLHKALHIADGAAIETLLGKTGGALPEQVAAADVLVLRNAEPARKRRLRRLLRGYNPNAPVTGGEDAEFIYSQILGMPERPLGFFFLMISLLTGAWLILKPVLEILGLSVNSGINIFLGILLQALPFLITGVLLSSAIQVFLPQGWIERRFPKSLTGGLLTAVVGGFFLPVCDCAAIPVFKSLVKKGIPLPAAVTFMTVSPVINPVVLLSTYYAFNGSWYMVLSRAFLGIVAAMVIGLTFALRPPRGPVLTAGAGGMFCACGCFGEESAPMTLGRKLVLLLRHAREEFFQVGKYLLLGALFSALFQALGAGQLFLDKSGLGLVVSILFMMAMAFLLSLCSSSDAVVARSLSGLLPGGAIMAFLVFGPMMDVKNLLMLGAGFSRRFILRLFLIIFSVCFGLVLLFSVWGGL